MATERQINANRKNAQKCTGPKTAAGRAISSQNALKTGLDAKSEVIRTENRADYEALTAEYYTRFYPTVPEERSLVDTLVTSEWLRRRYVRADAAVWEQRFEDTKSEAVGRVFKERSDIFVRVDRRINSAQRNFQNALKQLREIQSKRLAEEGGCPLPSRDCQGAVAEPTEPTETPCPDAAPEPLTPELDSSLIPFPQNAPDDRNTPTTGPRNGGKPAYSGIKPPKTDAETLERTHLGQAVCNHSAQTVTGILDYFQSPLSH